MKLADKAGTTGLLAGIAVALTMFAFPAAAQFAFGIAEQSAKPVHCLISLEHKGEQSASRLMRISVAAWSSTEQHVRYRIGILKRSSGGVSKSTSSGRGALMKRRTTKLSSTHVSVDRDGTVSVSISVMSPNGDILCQKNQSFALKDQVSGLQREIET